jgi:Trehalose utilisation
MLFALLKCLLLLALFLAVYGQNSTHPAHILIYSATADYRHDSIPTAIQALTARGPSINVQFDNTEDQTRFSDQGLAGYDALLFLDNTGEGMSLSGNFPTNDVVRILQTVLDEAGKTSLQRYLDLGGNFVAIHAASDCLRNTTFYGREVGAHLFDKVPGAELTSVLGFLGAFFDYHPPIQNAVANPTSFIPGILCTDRSR